MPWINAAPGIASQSIRQRSLDCQSRRDFLLGTMAGVGAAFVSHLAYGSTPKASATDGSTLIRDITLDNGLQVVVAPDHRLPLVTHTLWYKVGAGDEQLGRTGIAHFFEHLMFKGTARFPDVTFNRFVDRFGGQQNAFTSVDYTAYVQRMPKQHLLQLMAMEADRMTNLELTDAQIATERNAVLEEKRGNEVSDSTRYHQGVTAILNPGHRLGIPVIGTEADIKNLDRETLLAFYKRYYAPNNAVLIVGGDVIFEEVVELAKRTYGSIPPSATLPPRIRAPLAARPGSNRFEFDSAQTATVGVNRIFRLPPANLISPTDSIALGTLVDLSQGSIFEFGAFHHLVMNQKIASSAWANYTRELSSSEMRFGLTAVQGISAADAKQALDNMIANFRIKLPDEDVLAQVITKRIVNEIRSEDSNYAVVSGIGSILTKGLTLEQYTGYRARISQVTIQDLRRVMETYLKDDNSVLGVMTPKR
jgi:zinc protease